MPKLTDYAQQAATLAGEAEALFVIYEQLEPGAKTLIEGEFKKALAEFSTIKDAVENFKKASVFTKIGAGISLLSSVLDIGTVLQGIYLDGETYFAGQWPQIQQHFANIKAVLTGSPVPTAPALPAAAPALPDPASAT